MVRPDLLGTLVAFIVVLLAWCAAPFQLAFEQVTQQPEEPLTIGLGQILPPTDYLPGIGWGGAVSFTSRFFIRPPPEPHELWSWCSSFWEPRASLATVPA